jgi:hypothetical protein
VRNADPFVDDVVTRLALARAAGKPFDDLENARRRLECR